jgi:hypothetical protein
MLKKRVCLELWSSEYCTPRFMSCMAAVGCFEERNYNDAWFMRNLGLSRFMLGAPEWHWTVASASVNRIATRVWFEKCNEFNEYQACVLRTLKDARTACLELRSGTEHSLSATSLCPWRKLSNFKQPLRMVPLKRWIAEDSMLQAPESHPK